MNEVHYINDYEEEIKLDIEELKDHFEILQKPLFEINQNFEIQNHLKALQDYLSETNQIFLLIQKVQIFDIEKVDLHIEKLLKNKTLNLTIIKNDF
jgi:hypothetical protein